MKIDFKNGRVFNSICPIVFILMSQLYIIYFTNVDTLIEPFSKFLIKCIICLLISIAFSGLILFYLKVSHSRIARIIIMVVCGIGLPTFLMGIVAAFVNIAPDNLYKTVFIIFRTLVFILDLIIVFYSIFRMQEEPKKEQLM